MSKPFSWHPARNLIISQNLSSPLLCTSNYQANYQLSSEPQYLFPRCLSCTHTLTSHIYSLTSHCNLSKQRFWLHETPSQSLEPKACDDQPPALLTSHQLHTQLSRTSAALSAQCVVLRVLYISAPCLPLTSHTHLLQAPEWTPTLPSKLLRLYEKERSWVVCGDVDGPRDYHTERSKSEREQILCINVNVESEKKKLHRRSYLQSRNRDTEQRKRRMGWIGKLGLTYTHYWHYV